MQLKRALLMLWQVFLSLPSDVKRISSVQKLIWRHVCGFQLQTDTSSSIIYDPLSFGCVISNVSFIQLIIV